MLAEAADMVAARQASKKKPRTYGDYREMLKEKDLDIVLVATPDHWHALPMIAAVEAGADVYVQKPISVDVVEGQAMVAAARKHSGWCRSARSGAARRTWSRRATRSSSEGKLGKVGHVEIYCYYHMRPRENPPDTAPPETSTTRCGPARRRCGPTTSWSTRGAGGPSWNTATASSATCASTCSTWSAGCSASAGRSASPPPAASSWTRTSKANISDTQTATFDFGDLQVVWQHRTWGDAADPKYPWARHPLRRQGHAEGQRERLRLHPARQAAKPMHRRTW